MRITVTQRVSLKVEAEIEIATLGEPASRRGHPDSWTPEEGAEAEIVRVILRNAGRSGGVDIEIPLDLLDEDDRTELIENAIADARREAASTYHTPEYAEED